MLGSTLRILFLTPRSPLCAFFVLSAVMKELNAKNAMKTQRTQREYLKNFAELCVYSVTYAVINDLKFYTKYKNPPLLPRGDGFNSGVCPGAAAITNNSLYSSPRGALVLPTLAQPVINQSKYGTNAPCGRERRICRDIN